MTLQALVDY